MSDKDDPFGGRTVIRPNPGGGFGGPPRAAPVPGGPAPRPIPGADPFGAPPGGAPGRGESTVIRPMPAFPSAPPPMPGQGRVAPSGPPPMPMPGGARDQDWISGPNIKGNFFPEARKADTGPRLPKPSIPLEVALNARDGGKITASNPLTAAAAPLLILLGRLRLMIVEMHAKPLMDHVALEIEAFERKALESGFDENETKIAKYALSATADDIVQNLPGTDRDVWLQYSMVARYFGVRTSGVGFFEELDKVLANPTHRYELLELMETCLLLGFEGKYRSAGGGDFELQRKRREVYETLRRIRPRNDEDISPRWRGVPLSAKILAVKVPLWAIASFAGLILLAAYFLMRMLLTNDAEALADRMARLHRLQDLTIQRASFIPYEAPPEQNETTQLQRIRDALAGEIEQGGVVVEPVGENIVVRVNNLVLFASGKADVKPEFEPVALRIAAALDKEPGPIHVIGHTDNVKPRPTGRFKSNHDLSVARAKAVEKVIAPTLSDPSRLVVDGRGEDEPIADNGTEEGRAQNRRVEIYLPKEETL